ncbi:CemA family protein [Leptolyngbya sp. AN03gr2]|uniref:CemA family protein n=1 Tax=unclassified Leptolyngbya TaxID=2650499 RepID=UPI003D317EB2
MNKGWRAILARVQQVVDPNTESNAIAEFQASRQRTVAALRYFLLLLVIPLLVNQMAEVVLMRPVVQHTVFNSSEIVLSPFQEERILKEFRTFESRLRFEALLRGSEDALPTIAERRSEKLLEFAASVRQENVQVLSNIVADLLSAIVFIVFVLKTQPQFKLLKQFLSNLADGLSDSAKAFLIILVTDVFVGFHSSYGWEILLKSVFDHYGLAENRAFTGLFIATFPVILDAIGKYWIFRYLNRNSPSAVATYHRMNE